MKIKKILLLFCFLSSFWTLHSLFPLDTAYAQEGAVQTNGEVVLLDETTASSSSSEPTNETSDSTQPIQPGGKLPSTGELIQSSMSITGILVLLVLALFFFFKRKNAKNKEGADGQ